jgi:hypothetical protein
MNSSVRKAFKINVSISDFFQFEGGFAKGSPKMKKSTQTPDFCKK